MWSVEFHRGISYADLEKRQVDLAGQVQENPKKAFLLLSEPQATFTAGRSAKASELLWSEEELKRRGVVTVKTRRGGQWTFHGPGQIVGYPIVQLRSLGFSSRAVNQFLDRLAKSIQSVLGIPTERGCPFGLYRDGKKLASFGISISRGVVTHGFALNVRPVDRFFSGIHPCGVAQQPVTSLEELGGATDWDHTANALAEAIKKGLEFRP